MPKYAVAALPEGYIIARLHGKQYPMKLSVSANGVPTARGFIHIIDGAPVTYSKRVYAANFLSMYDTGRAHWAEVDGESPISEAPDILYDPFLQTKIPPVGGVIADESRIQFLESVVDDTEYSAYLDSLYAPRAEEY